MAACWKSASKTPSPKRLWRQAYRDIVEFERMLADDGAVILKFFLHISKKEQKERFEAIESDPLEAWRVTDEDWARHKKYDAVPRRHRRDAGADRIRIRALDHRRSHLEMARAQESLRDHHRRAWRSASAPNAPPRSEVRGAAAQGRGTARSHGIAGAEEAL